MRKNVLEAKEGNFYDLYLKHVWLTPAIISKLENIKLLYEHYNTTNSVDRDLIYIGCELINNILETEFDLYNINYIWYKFFNIININYEFSSPQDDKVKLFINLIKKHVCPFIRRSRFDVKRAYDYDLIYMVDYEFSRSYSVDIYRNQRMTHLVENLNRNKNVEALKLSAYHDHIVGYELNGLQNCQYIRHLDLARNSIEELGIKIITEMKQLDTLILSSNSIREREFEILCNSNLKLKNFDFTNNTLTDDMFFLMCDSPVFMEIEILILDNCSLSFTNKIYDEYVRCRHFPNLKLISFQNYPHLPNNIISIPNLIKEYHRDIVVVL